MTRTPTHDLRTPRSVPAMFCAECRASDVVAVCHHCGVGLCPDHACVDSGLGVEVLGLRLARDSRQLIHCPGCAHGDVSRSEILIGLALALLGLLLAIRVGNAAVWAFAALFLLLPGLVPLLGLLWLWRRTPPVVFPTFPLVENERVIETYRHEIRLLADGRYAVRSLGSSGLIRAELRWEPEDAERFQRYLKHRRQRPEEADSPRVALGFVAAQLAKDAAVVDVNPGLSLGPSGVRARAVEVNALDHPYLYTGDAGAATAGRAVEPGTTAASLDLATSAGASGAGSRPGSVVDWMAGYTVADGSVEGQVLLPFDIVPALLPRSNRCGMSISLRWHDRVDWSRPSLGHGPRLSLADPLRVRQLRLRFPTSLGRIEAMGGDVPLVASLIDDDEGNHWLEVKWEDVPLRTAGRSDPLETPGDGKVFYIKTEHPIRPDATIRGDVAVEFDGSFVGIEDLNWFTPLGAGVRSPRTRCRTSIEARFELSLASVRYEDAFQMLDEQLLQSQVMLANIRPDHRTAIEVVHWLANAGHHVYDIRESIHSMPDSSLGLSRLWKLKGRHFSELTPLEFGVEIEGADSRGQIGGLTTVRASFHGTYDSNEAKMDANAIAESIRSVTLQALQRIEGTGRPALESGE